ncbi:hypothetical protein C1646_810845 [Rhizophagus diaphanus]|nr:hypothetical protein C1646_810845 [Rhizophagus diaphanus] [Rhizophagus sp. MUCL 43196]
MGGKLDVDSEVGVVKELICEDKENVTDSNLDGDIIFIVDDIDQLKKIISKVDSKQVPIAFTATLAKHVKKDEEKLLEEENSYFTKLIMTPPISDDDNSKDFIGYNSQKTSSISPTINDPSIKSDSDSSLLSVAPLLRPSNSLSCNLEPKVLVVEDNAVNRTILTTFLKKRGIRFDEAENGAI